MYCSTGAGKCKIYCSQRAVCTARCGPFLMHSLSGSFALEKLRKSLHDTLMRLQVLVQVTLPNGRAFRTDKEADGLVSMTMMNQKVLDALMESIEKNCASIPVV